MPGQRLKSAPCSLLRSGRPHAEPNLQPTPLHEVERGWPVRLCQSDARADVCCQLNHMEGAGSAPIKDVIHECVADVDAAARQDMAAPRCFSQGTALAGEPQQGYAESSQQLHDVVWQCGIRCQEQQGEQPSCDVAPLGMPVVSHVVLTCAFAGLQPSTTGACLASAGKLCASLRR